MQLSSQIHSLHERALKAAEQFRRAEAELLEALSGVDQKKVYLSLGYSSLFVYATQALRLPESVAYNAISVMRKAQEVPALKAHISSGELSISKARKVISVLNPDQNASSWIEKALTLSTRSLEKEVAKENPKSSTPEKAKYVSARRLDVNLGLEEASMLRLRRTQDLVSGVLGKPASLEETLEVLTEFYLKHKDPVVKARRVMAKKGLSSSSKASASAKIAQAKETAAAPAPVPVPDPNKRTEVPAPIAHSVRLRDEGKCQYKRHSQTAICGETRWVELHHLKPVSQGGEHSLQNLVTLCKNHHAGIHQLVGGNESTVHVNCCTLKI
jgi:hypothetical protein